MLEIRLKMILFIKNKIEERSIELWTKIIDQGKKDKINQLKPLVTLLLKPNDRIQYAFRYADKD